jgi:hypothetical protein
VGIEQRTHRARTDGAVNDTDAHTRRKKGSRDPITRDESRVRGGPICVLSCVLILFCPKHNKPVSS